MHACRSAFSSAVVRLQLNIWKCRCVIWTHTRIFALSPEVVLSKCPHNEQGIREWLHYPALSWLLFCAPASPMWGSHGGRGRGLQLLKLFSRVGDDVINTARACICVQRHISWLVTETPCVSRCLRRIPWVAVGVGVGTSSTYINSRVEADGKV